MASWNLRFNLTAVTGYEDVQRKHFLDSLSCILALPSDPRAGGTSAGIPDTVPLQVSSRPLWCLDVGSGAGFPGLPLKIMFPEVEMTLVEATGKKAAFLRHMVEILDLENVQVLNSRVEDVGRMPQHRERYDLVLVRAVAHMCVLVEYCLPLCRVGGRMVAQKGEDAEQEALKSRQAIALLGGLLVEVKPVLLPDSVGKPLSGGGRQGAQGPRELSSPRWHTLQETALLMSDLRRVLEQLRMAGEVITHVTAWRVLDPRPPEYGEWPADLDARLATMLSTQGIRRLYVHQSCSVQHVLEGRNVVVVTPTASGKTLCYNLPVLNALLTDDQARALYLFPTKALAHDQLHTLEASIRALELNALVAAYDGDTPSSTRARIKRSARVLLTNPDMLHLGILPYHAQWRDFISNLKYVVIDELHQYRGIFGSHVANVLRRLARICRFYGSQPQFICCSATIANPVDLAGRLLGRQVELVSHNGAPRGERTLVFYNPPMVNQELGLRRQALLEARSLAGRLIAHDVQTVIFGRSRQSVELLLTYLRQDAERMGRDPAHRSGLSRRVLAPGEARHRRGPAPRNDCGRGRHERFGVGSGYRGTGSVHHGGVSRDYCWHVATGRPRWPRHRGERRLARRGSSPLDQYIISHPDYFFGQTPEHALINPDNLHVLLSHVKCATFELPFAPGEGFGLGGEHSSQDLGDLLRFLEAEGLVRQVRGSWYWSSSRYPAQEVSLRTTDPTSVTIEVCEQDDARHTIGQLDRPSAPLWLHEGAIYLHDGQQYLVEALDWDAGRATVRAVAVDYYTEASRSTRIAIERVQEEVHHDQVTLARGEVLLTSRVTSYRRMRLGSLEHLRVG